MTPEEKNKACANYSGDYGMGSGHGLSGCQVCGYFHHCCDSRYNCLPEHTKRSA